MKRPIKENEEYNYQRIYGTTDPGHYTGRKFDPNTGQMETEEFPVQGMYNAFNNKEAEDARIKMLKKMEKEEGNQQIKQVKDQEKEMAKQKNESVSESSDELELTDLLTDPEFRDIVLNLLQRINMSGNELSQVGEMFPEELADKWINKKLSEWIYKD